MHKTALLLYEVARTIENESGSSEARPTPRNDDMLLLVYKAIDEPDSFYGIHEVNSIASVGDRLAYEGNVIQSLLFRGAQLDGLSRRDAQTDESTRAQLISAMGAANLNTIIQDLVTDVGGRDASVGPDNNMYIAALQLNRWDVAVPADIKAPIAVLYRALQGVANARQLDDARFAVRAGLLDISADLRKSITVESTISDALSSLASLNEIDDLLASSGAEQLQAIVSMMEKREDWMITGR
jgi:ataxia telangiectasia mutated family protein